MRDQKTLNMETEDNHIHPEIPCDWERQVPGKVYALEKAGLLLNPDINSGDVMGLEIMPNYFNNGIRSSTADLLRDPLLNLTILTNGPVMQILFQNKNATRVQTEDNTYLVRKEVFLSAGTLDSPKLLMLSGVAPASELFSLGINLVHGLHFIGKGLWGHFLSLQGLNELQNCTDQTALYSNPEVYEAARSQWLRDQTGPFSKILHTLPRAAPPSSVPDWELIVCEKEFVRSATVSGQHMAGTVNMGKPTDQEACIDSTFRVRGLQNLRVADLSVMPIMPKSAFLAHSQVAAYLIGHCLAEKFIVEYKLNVAKL
ncbi:hypothetical protein B7463_g5395, partial [Scytalidium lignicola]